MGTIVRKIKNSLFQLDFLAFFFEVVDGYFFVLFPLPLAFSARGSISSHTLCSQHNTRTNEMRMKRFYGLHNDLLHLIDGMLKLNQNSSSVAHNNNYAFILQPESDFVAMAVNVRPMRTEGKSEGRDCVGSACISVSIFPIRLNVFLFVGVFDATQFCNCN